MPRHPTHSKKSKPSPKKGGSHTNQCPSHSVVSVHHAMKPPLDLHLAIGHLKKLLTQPPSLSAVAAKGSWFGSAAGPPSDVKDGVPTIARDFVSMMRSSLASAYGSKAVPFKLPVSATFTATAVTGVASTALTLRVSDSVEYASLASLFDEFRFKGGVFDYTVPCPTPTIVLATSSLSYDANVAVGFDPSDNTAPSGARAVTELAQHEQHFPRIVATPTVGTYVGVYGDEKNKPFRFSWSAEKVQLMTDSLGNVTTVGQWKGCATTPQSDGFLKVYYQSGETTARTVITGTMYWNVDFRSRT